MAISIVRFGSPRAVDEGVRLGTVRRPPRGVRKEEVAKRDYYDVWLPSLAPSAGLRAVAKTVETPAQFAAFARAFRRELEASGGTRTLDVLAALSHTSNFALGCYCENEERCHRWVLRAMLAERGATLRDAS